MPDVSFLDREARVATVPAGPVRLAMIVMGFIPLGHLLLVAACVAFQLAWAAPVMLYLLPPLACRLAGVLRPGRLELNSSGFLTWWFTLQWQMVFNRLVFLEELLRLVPGAYSAWLRLWGARVGRLVTWSPGFTLLDRSLLEAGDRVIFGAGVRVVPHLLSPDEAGRMFLTLATVRVGGDSLIGGYSVLSPGVRIGAAEVLPALTPLPPFSEWTGGRRTRPPRGVWN